ncbi:MAG TPA: MarR family transcriptional regulator [Elusimicrobiota bacterium]|nr:MarR family transcriptional regulator [Elusimicrobiota bacterium]
MNKARDLEYHVGYWLRFVSNHVSGAFQQRLATYDVTAAEWVTLRSIDGLRSCSLSELAERMGSDPSTVSRLVERVLRKGLAVRNHSEEDRRRIQIELTKTGLSLVPRLAQEADANDERYFGHLSRKERKTLSELMQGLVQKHGWKDKPIS